MAQRMNQGFLQYLVSLLSFSVSRRSGGKAVIFKTNSIVRVSHTKLAYCIHIYCTVQYMKK